jgi:hypothetical protein
MLLMINNKDKENVTFVHMHHAIQTYKECTHNFTHFKTWHEINMRAQLHILAALSPYSVLWKWLCV